ncbi:MAG: hypothetical protein COW01_03185 [Bdellovibrionales bacterium CG12_big_fil_rev_8_21_14_0_65_38_15]|nr:MAG: hypothetical protein COW79_12425 [Bdellovibrionales bacterium CG22_combo_CG10-13_8_21_14_all_38_13]PIQ56849.1 MAG: hypothetical protein COW01_03185 [Bdellovibrionales bacterium CG12_big_fil_rev_8_21_14_0_65_38_15]PIR30014.1 MAG: hypothetical protein COV38_06905 [Bdellovibrionales bacterium CG11_big_fil_rev_8_21_14_0_20_38_13]
MKQHSDHDGQWFIFKGDQHRGPYQTDEMVNLFALGVIGHKDLVWKEGGGTWLPFADQTIFKDLIFKEQVQIDEKPPASSPESIEVANQHDHLLRSASDVDIELPPLPDEVSMAIDHVAIHDEQINSSHVEEDHASQVPDLPPQHQHDINLDEDKTSPNINFESSIIEEPTKPWLKISAGIAAGFVLVATIVWFTQFSLQTYDLIGLEAADVEQFNQVIIDHKSAHIVRMTKDSNVIWAAVPGVLEGEAFLKLASVPGRVLSTDSVEIMSQGELVQGLVPFKRFEFVQTTNWIRGEYTYELAVKPKGTTARLASMLSAYPWFKSMGWVQFNSRGYVFQGRLSFYEGSANKFNADLQEFREKIWDSLSKPLQYRLEKYETLSQMAKKLDELWHQRLDVAVTWRAFKKYDEGYARDIAPVLQSLILDSMDQATKLEEQSPMLSRLYREIEESAKQLGEVASLLSAESKAIRQYRRSDKTRMKARFTELYEPLKLKIDQRLSSLKKDIEDLKTNYNSSL